MKYVKLGNYTRIRTGKLNANESSSNGAFPFFTCSKQTLKIDSYSYDTECVLVAGNGEINVKYYNGKFDAYQRTYIIESIDKSKMLVKYIYYFMISYINVLKSKSIGGVIKYIKLDNITEAKIPILSIDEQIIVVNYFEKYQLYLDFNKKILSNLDTIVKSRFIEMFGDPLENEKGFKTKKLAEACPFNTYKGVVKPIENKYWLLNLDMIEPNTGQLINRVMVEEDEIGSSTLKFDTNCVLYSKLRPYLNKVIIPDMSGYCTTELVNMSVDEKKVNKKYLASLLRSNSFVGSINSKTAGAKMPRASMDWLRNFDLMLPPIELQNQFATFVEQTDKSKYNRCLHNP